MIDLRDGVTRPASRRFAPYHVPETDRDALAATALAAHKAVTQAPSVLDVDATSLRLSRSRPRRKAEPEPQWTPPVLTVDEAVVQPESDPLEELDEVGLRRRPRVKSARAKWLAGAAAIGLVGLLAGGIGGMLREREDQAVDPQAVPVTVDEVADPALLPEDGLAEDADQNGEAPVASVEGKLTLTDATLHDRLAGAAAPPSTSFTTSSEVILYLGYASWEPEADDRLGVIWFSGDTEVARSEVELSDGTAHTFVTAPPFGQAGPHRADVTLNDEVIASLPFEVLAP